MSDIDTNDSSSEVISLNSDLLHKSHSLKSTREGIYLSKPHVESPLSSFPEGAEEDDEEKDHISFLPTPVAGRSKKEREWYWTLGPVESGEANGPKICWLDVGKGV